MTFLHSPVTVSLPSFMVNSRYLLFVPLAGILATSCAGQNLARTSFKIPDKLPLFQVIADLDSSFEWEDHQKRPLNEILADYKATNPPVENASSESQKTANLLSGPMVPIAADGYCLTTAHNLGKGGAMNTLQSQIGDHKFGSVYTIVDLKNECPSLFCNFEQNSGGIVTPIRKGFRQSNRFVAVKSKTTRVKIFSRDLDTSEFKTMQNQLRELDAAFMIRFREIKVWGADDLALVKLPFATPSHFTIAEEGTPIAANLMVFGNPGVHNSEINYVSKLTDQKQTEDFPIGFSEFYPLMMSHSRIGKQGDSGGPVIDRNGKLVGINIATHTDADGRSVDLAVGLRRETIMKAIEDARRAVE